MISKNHVIIDNELYNVVKGEIVAINNNSTYDIKVSDTKNKYPHIKNVNHKKVFDVGDIVKIGLEYENKKLPIILS